MLFAVIDILGLFSISSIGSAICASISILEFAISFPILNPAKNSIKTIDVTIISVISLCLVFNLFFILISFFIISPPIYNYI